MFTSELYRSYEVLRRRWWVPLGLSLLLGGGALAWGIAGAKVYRVEVVLAPIAEEELDSSLSQLTGQFAGIASMLGVNLGSAGRSEDVAIATLRSRQFTADFLEEMDLLPILFKDRWDEQRKEWRSSFFGRIPSLPYAVEKFSRDVRSVNQDRRTGLVHLTIEWNDPDVAASWANDIVARINERMRNRTINEAEQSIAFLSEEAAKANLVGVQQAAYRLIESQLNRITLAKVRSEYAFRVVDPATPPDARDFVRPRLGLLATVGIALGASLGVFLLLLAARLRNDVSS